MQNLKLQRTAWFAEAKYGFFFHFLNPHYATKEHPDQNFPLEGEEWEREVEQFNVELFAKELSSLNAGYAFLTVGQNSGYYCSPNRTYDELMGGSFCSRRDLIMDFADALARYNIPALAYTTGLAPYLNRRSVEKLECVPPWQHLSCNAYDRYRELITPDSRLKNFQYKWNDIHREWSERWKDKIKGWWVDGTHAGKMYDFSDSPNGKSFADALRAGNPDSIIAFNAGCVVEPSAEYPLEEDYTAGEMNTPFYGVASGPLVDGLRYHLLSYIGSYWSRRPLRFTGEEMAEITRNVNDNGGVMTWDLPFTADKGIDEDAYDLLQDFVAAYKKSRKFFPVTSVAIEQPGISPDQLSISGKAVIRSQNLAGAEIQWNGEKHICGEGDTLEIPLSPLLPEGELKITRNGICRRYPVTTRPMFQLTEDYGKTFSIYSNEAPEQKLASYRMKQRESLFILEGTVYENGIVQPEDHSKLCYSGCCSCAVLFFALDHKRKSEIYLRPDGHIFRIEGMTVAEAANVRVRCTPVSDGKYTIYAEIPFENLPTGKLDEGNFLLNIAQHTFQNGKHVAGMLFGGRNKVWAPSYDSALFLSKKTTHF